MDATKEPIKNKKSPARLLFGIALLLFGAYVLYGGITGLADNKSRLTASKGTLTIETVDSDSSRAQGLSGRSSIGDNEGMLFIFDETVDTNCFWMKDMQFSIDMVWLNEKKEVVTVIPEVAPETFPESFCPTQPAKYGLEIAASRAEELEIKLGQELRF